MSKSNLPSQIRLERVPDSTLRAVAALIVGLILIVAGILLAFKDSRVSTRESPTLQFTPGPPAPSTASLPSSDVAKSVNPREKVSANPNELGQTLEEFQAEYESLSAKGGDQETFFKTLVGKKVVWTVRVDRVFLTEPGVIVIFSSTERPDWAAFPISDALFPAQLEKQLMKLSRGDVIRIEGKIVYRGIKTLECSSFELMRKDEPVREESPRDG
jgi:hypothetical protein